MKQPKTLLVVKTILLFSLVLAALMITAACDARMKKSTGQIYLYGEVHSVPRIMDGQLEIWQEYYHNQNMRHMFIEDTYFTSEYLNIWMQSDNDDILYLIYENWAGTQAHNPHKLAFLKTIKSEFPETIFHGIDIGHQFESTGKHFLQYLQDNNMQDSERYLLTLEAIEQGEIFYKSYDFDYRETKMAENFIRTFDRLENQNVMGIFGTRHARFGFMKTGGQEFPSMAERLRERYGESVHTENLAWYGLEADPIPIKVDTVIINDNEYKASYFGTRLYQFDDFVSLSYWRLENAYNDFRGKPAKNDWHPFENFPMIIEENQVFFIDAERKDGSVLRLFYRSDGEYLHGDPITTGFSLD